MAKGSKFVVHMDFDAFLTSQLGSTVIKQARKEEGEERSKGGKSKGKGDPPQQGGKDGGKQEANLEGTSGGQESKGGKGKQAGKGKSKAR